MSAIYSSPGSATDVTSSLTTQNAQPLPSPEAARKLARAFHDDGDVRAREQLIELHLPIVRSVARRYAARGEPLDDLVQAGAVGLIQAADRFDPVRGVPFAAYAVTTVDGSIRRHLRDLATLVRPPRRLAELSASLHRIEPELETRLERPPTADELATEAGATVGDVLAVRASASARRPVPLTAPPARLAALQEADEEYDDSERRLLVGAAFRALTRRERRILRLRFYAELSQDEIAAELGLSQVHVSRLIRSSLAKMRAALGQGEPAGHRLAG